MTRKIPLLTSLFPLGLGIVLALGAHGQATEEDLPQSGLRVPVSINALMVTLIDHSAHYIWDYANNTFLMGDAEWLAIEYYAIQLAAAAPLITLGGAGALDDAWVENEEWTRFSKDMMAGAETAMDAARLHDDALLDQAGEQLIRSCEGCHEAFKPNAPTEGLAHDPYYDHLYHFLIAEPAIP